jgi:hypothetical protein
MRTGCFARMSVFEQAIDDQSHAQLEARAARLRQPGKQFKLGFFTQVPSRADQPARRTYDELVESIVAAEDIGYDSVWIGQHHFSPRMAVCHLLWSCWPRPRHGPSASI